MKHFAAPRACRVWKAKRCIGIIFFRTFVLRITLMLSRISSEPLMSVRNKHNYKIFSESPPAVPPYFNQLERQATIFEKQNQNLCMKRALPIDQLLPLGKLDNNLSPRVGDFAQKIIPDLICPGGNPRGYTWYFHYTPWLKDSKQQVTHLSLVEPCNSHSITQCFKMATGSP